MLDEQFKDEIKPQKQDNIDKSQATLAMVYFFMSGATTDIASSSVLNTIDYFAAQFPQAGVTFLLPIPFFLGMLIACLTITRISNKFSYSCRMTTSMLVSLILVAFCPFEASAFKDTGFGLGLLLLITLITGFFSNIIYTSLGGITSQLENKFIVSFLIGAGISNLFTTVLREIILLIFKPKANNDILNVAVFLLLIAAILGMCLILHLFFIKSTFYKSRWGQSPTVDYQMLNEEAFLQQRVLENPSDSQTRNLQATWQVMKQNWLFLVFLLVGMAQMTIAYPGLMFLKHIPDISDPVKTVSMMATFHVCIIIGKKIAELRKYYNKYTVLILVVIRFALVIFFVIQAETTQIAVFNTVWFGYLNIAVFGLTTGFVVCAGFLLGNEQVEKEKKEVAGFISVGAVTLGVGIGDALALIFRNLSPQ